MYLRGFIAKGLFCSFAAYDKIMKDQESEGIIEEVNCEGHGEMFYLHINQSSGRMLRAQRSVIPSRFYLKFNSI